MADTNDQPNEQQAPQEKAKTVWDKLPEGHGRLTISFGNVLNRMSLNDQARFLANVWEAIAPGVKEKYGIQAVSGQVVGDPRTKSAYLALDLIKKTPQPGG